MIFLGANQYIYAKNKGAVKKLVFQHLFLLYSDYLIFNKSYIKTYHSNYNYNNIQQAGLTPLLVKIIPVLLDSPLLLSYIFPALFTPLE